MLTQHWLPFMILAFLIATVFVPGMRQKDQSLSRYPEFADYKEHSGFLLPRLFMPATSDLEKAKLAKKMG